jgi:DNA-directed RNA polymerase subunit N (RpoN/RPB10)
LPKFLSSFSAELRLNPRSVRKLESSVSRRVPVVVAQQSAKPLAVVHPPFFRSGLRPLHGRLAEDLKATRAAVAILKSNATECRFSILGHVLLLVNPAGQRRRHQLVHVHRQIITVSEHSGTMRNLPQSRILNRLGISAFCCNRISGHYAASKKRPDCSSPFKRTVRIWRSR